MWQLIIVLVITVVNARPQVNQSTTAIDLHNKVNLTTTTTPAAILSQVDTNSPDGSFNSSYETSNGIKVENAGYLKQITVPQYEDLNGKLYDAHDEIILVQIGSFSYYDPSGNLIYVSYLADENGFQPTGNHLPTVAPSGMNQYSSDQAVNSNPQAGIGAARQFSSGTPPNGFTENRPIQGQQPQYQDRPIQSNPGFNQQNRPIQSNPGFNQQNRPISQSNSNNPGFNANRPIIQGQQPQYQDQTIQQTSQV